MVNGGSSGIKYQKWDINIILTSHPVEIKTNNQTVENEKPRKITSKTGESEKKASKKCYSKEQHRTFLNY